MRCLLKRHNPYPGLTRTVDRHRKVRWRFRMKGRPECYIAGVYGSKDFQAAYELAVNGESKLINPTPEAERGTFDWLIEQYKRTPKWQNIGPVYKKNLSYQFERFRLQHGWKSVSHLELEHVEAILSKKHNTPAAANELLKLLRRLCRFAIRRGVITIDPTVSVEKYKTNPDGFHTWTEDEILKFEKFHGAKSKPVLAMRLMLFTGASRQDVARLGWQNIKYGRIAYRRRKTGVDVDLPIHPRLDEVIGMVSLDQMIFILNAYGTPFKPTTFGNWFGDQCSKAEIPGRAHGLRKSGATALADAGCTEFEIMAYLGHATPKEAATYTKKANRAKLGDSGTEKLLSVSNPVERLDKYQRKRMKNKEK
jgi:integrase